MYKMSAFILVTLQKYAIGIIVSPITFPLA